jgi:hypothetical protein
MTGRSCRLLLAASLMIAAPEFLCGQNASPNEVPVLVPNLSQLRYSSPNATPKFPPFADLARYPTSAGTRLFRGIVRSAGVIFSGRVISIGHDGSASGEATPSTTVTFRVERAIRGTSAGQDLTIHEWAGLWAGGERYRIGEHVLLFLYSPGRLGFSSPVAGSMGRFSTNSRGDIVMNPQHFEALATDPILGGRTVVPYAAFTQAVRLAGRQE